MLSRVVSRSSSARRNISTALTSRRQHQHKSRRPTPQFARRQQPLSMSRRSLSTSVRPSAPTTTTTTTTPGFLSATVQTASKAAFSLSGIASYLINSNSSTNTNWKESNGTLYQFKLTDLDNNTFDLSQLKGKVVLITNVACECGFTKGGYNHMVAWKNQHQNEPFEVVAFPSNQFHQENRTPAEIKQYVTDNFDVNFPLMQKTLVNGDDASPVYKWLKESFPGDIGWNFGSYFLIDHRGVPIARYDKESWDTIAQAIDNAIAVAVKQNPATTTTDAAPPAARL